MISIIVPVLNEAENLKKLLPNIYEFSTGIDVELIIVDGRSTDATDEVVKQFMQEQPNLHLLVQSGKGFANALMEGILAAKGETIVTMDAENHKPSEIQLLIDKLGEGFDVVVGSRFLKDSKVDLQTERFISTRIANQIAEASFKLDVKDTSSGFRAYKAKSIKKALEKGVETEYFSVQVEILVKIKELGGRLGEVGVHYLRRDSGESKYNLKPALKDAGKLMKMAGDTKLKEIKNKIKKQE